MDLIIALRLTTAQKHYPQILWASFVPGTLFEILKKNQKESDNKWKKD